MARAHRKSSLWSLEMMMMAILLTSGISYTWAYRISDMDNLAETETCNRFLVRPGYDFQLRAFPASAAGGNNTEDWLGASDVARECGTVINRAYNGFYEYLTKYPTTIKYWLYPQGKTGSPAETYRLTSLASWGDLTDPSLRAECDYEGNAYFVPSSGLFGTGDFVPQIVSSIDWNTTESPVLETTFDLQLKGDLDPAPIFGEGFQVVPVLCRIRPEKDNDSQILWPARPLRYPVKFEAEIRHWWGLLHPEMWSELVLLAVISFPKLFLVVWFFYRCRMFRDQVLTQQKYFLWISLFSFLSSFAFAMFLVGANANGMDTCCPMSGSSTFFLFLKLTTNMMFNLLLLATAKGWGVVNPKLNKTDEMKIGVFLLATMTIYVLSRVMKPNFAIVYLQLINETSIWCWIFFCLKQTRMGLSQSSRIDRHAKIDMYDKLNKLLLFGLILWGAIVTLVVWVVLIVYNREGRLIIFDIPPTLAWDVTLLLMMWGFGWVWRPSPATAQFSYTFARQEEEGIDSRDPVSDFGLEST